MTKPFHAGAACRTGVTAARLVKSGFTASQDAIEGRFGFLRAFSGGMGYTQEQVLQTLGKRCYLVESGIEVKKYPCCGSAHLALDALFGLMKREQIEPGQVERVEVIVDFDPPRSLIHYRPRTSLEGKFSMQYCLAAALLDSKVGLHSFTDQQVLRPEAQGLITKVGMHRIPGHEGQPSWSEGYNEVEVHLKDGRMLKEKAERITSGALRGVTMQDIQSKFRDCASLVLSHEATEELLGALDRLEELENIHRLADLLRGDGAKGTL
jgi:2-methylcitrate dehydratase PrpD